MTALETALRQICLDLTETCSSFALVGGLAVSARTEPRFTRDADIAVSVRSDSEAEDLVRSLRAAADKIELLPKLRLHVATTGHLIALKVLARDDLTRPQDLGDLRALLRVASSEDVDRARGALALIAERGYHRGRDLQSEMDKLRTSHEQS